MCFKWKLLMSTLSHSLLLLLVFVSIIFVNYFSKLFLWVLFLWIFSVKLFCWCFLWIMSVNHFGRSHLFNIFWDFFLWSTFFISLPDSLFVSNILIFWFKHYKNISLISIMHQLVFSWHMKKSKLPNATVKPIKSLQKLTLLW